MLRKYPDEDISKKKGLLFSVIIPTYNRAEKLKSCLDAFTKFDYARDKFEVIVVDDGSFENLEPFINDFETDLDIKLFVQGNLGPAAARNRGAKKAVGKFLAFIDDDCIPDSFWLKKFENELTKHPDCLVGGRIINGLKLNPYSATSQMISDAVYSYYNSAPERARFFSTNNMAVSREKFFTAGGFNSGFRTSEDREFCARWLRQALIMRYVSEAVVRHEHQMTFSTFWNQHFSYGRGSCKFNKLNAVRGKKGIRLEKSSFYWHLFRYAFPNKFSVSTIFVEVLLIVSQFASACGFIVEFFQHLEMTRPDQS